MFLDDEIVELVLNTDLSDKERKGVCVTQVRNLIVTRILKYKDEIHSLDELKREIIKASNLFDSAARKLKDKGIPLLKIGGVYEHFKREFPDLKL